MSFETISILVLKFSLLTILIFFGKKTKQLIVLLFFPKKRQEPLIFSLNFFSKSTISSLKAL